MIGVFDTNIVIDCLNGVPEAADEIDRYTVRATSRITWIEVLAGTSEPGDESAARSFLSEFQILEVTPAVAAQSVRVRRERKIKLPDAIIYATALELGAHLITRNTRDFPETDPIIRVPYRR